MNAKERPILFSAPMVRAILEGRKTQTRRVIKPEPYLYENCAPVLGEHRVLGTAWYWHYKPSIGVELNTAIKQGWCPYGSPGDHLWVREKHYQYGKWVKAGKTIKGREGYPDVAYIGEKEIPADRTALTWHIRPSIHMPRWASRITLEITGIRVERVQEITIGDVIAEGYPKSRSIDSRPQPIPWFIELWNSINARRGFGWDKNPWVWVISFKKLPSSVACLSTGQAGL